MSSFPKIKPFLWLLFSAGGTIAAFFLPVFLAILTVDLPQHLLSSQFWAYPSIKDLLTNSWALKFCVFSFFVLIFWHSMHRLFLTAIDLFHVNKCPQSLTILFYGFTLLTTVYTLIVLGAL